MQEHIQLTVVESDIATFPADVIALKYAQDFHGADRMIARRLEELGISRDTLQPAIGDHCYASAHGSLAAQHVLFIGVPALYDLDYAGIRQFGEQVLATLAGVAPAVRQVAMTIHGPGFGLDEAEALLAQVEGLLDAMRAGRMPSALERITIVDRNHARVARLRTALDERLVRASFATRIPDGEETGFDLDVPALQGRRADSEAADAIPQPEAGAVERPHAFVAMSYSTQLDDVFYYGIQKPVHDAGLLCERVDKSAFTGGIIERIKQKIETAAVVIAELTDHNPNVYLEVGYAWGRGRPTILLAPNTDDLPFDVKGQRCLTYSGIRNLETQLLNELQQLRARGVI